MDKCREGWVSLAEFTDRFLRYVAAPMVIVIINHVSVKPKIRIMPNTTQPMSVQGSIVGAFQYGEGSSIVP
jgi:hypothetical protein